MGTDLKLNEQQDQVFIMKALIIFRMVVISFFLGSVILFQLMFGTLFFPLPISLLISATYLASIIYLFLLNRISRYTLFLSFQLGLDLVIETGIIYSTGGISSPFTFLYFFTIIASAIVLPRRASYVIASVASIFYGLLINLEFYNVLSPFPLLERAVESPSQEYIFFTVLIHIAAFYLVAFLSDFLSQRLGATLRELISKSRDLTYLQAFHENVITNMGSGFLALDMEGRVISTNQAAEKILERTLENLRTRKFSEIFPTAPVSGLLPSVSGSGGEGKVAEWIYGGEKLLSANSTLFRDSSGDVRGYIIIFQDITHVKKMEEAVARSERLATIGRIAAGLAHEIRNPLGSISGSIQILKSEIAANLSAHNEKLMGIILRETDRLNAIIENFLSSSSPDRKKEKGVQLAKIISEAAMLFRNDANYSHVKIETNLDENIRHEADPESIKQVFWNLMINAAQAMADGGKITITMKPIISKDGAVERCAISVKDTGEGIDEADGTKIFEPFYTTKEKGTGLGLATVLKIVESHSGSISVESRRGVGTTFTIDIPVTAVAATAS